MGARAARARRRRRGPGVRAFAAALLLVLASACEIGERFEEATPDGEERVRGLEEAADEVVEEAAEAGERPPGAREGGEADASREEPAP